MLYDSQFQYARTAKHCHWPSTLQYNRMSHGASNQVRPPLCGEDTARWSPIKLAIVDGTCGNITACGTQVFPWILKQWGNLGRIEQTSTYHEEYMRIRNR